jgi:hypothetical protein
MRTIMPDISNAPRSIDTAVLTNVRVTDGAGKSTSLTIPPTTLDLGNGPIARMRIFTDDQGTAHIEYDVAQDQPPQEHSPVPNDPLQEYFLGDIIVKRANKPDLV